MSSGSVQTSQKLSMVLDERMRLSVVSCGCTSSEQFDSVRENSTWFPQETDETLSGTYSERNT
jgi:hypothetical protein